MFSMKHFRPHFSCVLTLTIAACADLASVRDFAKAGSAISANEPVIREWPNAYATAVRLASSPQIRAHAPALSTDLQRQIAGANADAPLALEATKALKLYMDVLAALADDKLADVSQQATSISSALGTLGAVDSKAKDATSGLVKLVGIALDAWRRVAIHDLVKTADPDVQTIAIFLARTADAVEIADKAAARVTDQYWEITATLSRDPGVQALLLNSERVDDSTFQTRIDQAAAAKAAFQKIATDHAVLAKNADDLSGKEVVTTLQSDLPILISVLQLFQRK
jgi:hypothetical protein